MTEDVERVARAAFMASECRYRSAEGAARVFDCEWEADSGFRERWEVIARAAIAALREPSEAMVDAAYRALETYDIAAPGACTVRYAHHAIIDAALGEQKAETS